MLTGGQEVGVNDILSGAKMAHLRKEAGLLSLATTYDASPHLPRVTK